MIDDINYLTIEDAESLGIENVRSMYRSYVSSSQVDLIGSFIFGRELAEYSEGCYIYLKDKKILDITGGIGVLNHGHNHPRILEVRKSFNEKKRMEVHKNYFSPYVAALSHNVAKLLPGDLNISYFPNSGAEAVEGAMKMAYKYHNANRNIILHSDISFHGKLLGAASVTGSPELNFIFPQIPGTRSFEYNNIDSVNSLINANRKDNNESDIYAILVEPLNASSMRNCSERFLLELREICNKEDIILIFDEVYTGWGKTGELFNFMYYDGLIPDILTYAKSFGGGKSSISGYTSREHIFRKAYDNLRDATLHSTTYYGFGEECVTAIESLNIIVEENFVSNSKNIGSILDVGLNKLQNKYPKIISDVRGSGALWGIVLNTEISTKIMSIISNLVPLDILKDKNFMSKLVTASVISELYNKHNILSFYGANIEIPLIISFPLIAKEEEVKYALDAIDSTLSKGILNLLISFVKVKFS
jgi:putrescine aminotransferase